MSKKSRSNTIKLLLTDRAVGDFREIEDYSIKTWGELVTNRYLLKFEKAFRLLKANPGLLLSEPRFHESILFYRVEKHVLACIRVKSGIIVLTIVHAGRDLLTLLDELAPTLKHEVSLMMKQIKDGSD